MSIAATSVFALTASMVDKRSIDQLIQGLTVPAQVVSESNHQATVISSQEAMNLVSSSLATIALLNEKCEEWRDKVEVAGRVDIFSEPEEILVSTIAELEDSARSFASNLITFKVLYFRIDVAPEWKPHTALYSNVGQKIIRCLANMRNVHEDMAHILRQHLPQASMEVSVDALATADIKKLVECSHQFWNMPLPKWS